MTKPTGQGIGRPDRLRRTIHRVMALGALGIVAFVPAEAAEWRLRFGAAYVAPTGELTGSRFTGFAPGAIPIVTDYVDSQYRVEPQGAAAAFVGLEVPLGRRFGLEVSIEGSESDLDLTLIRDWYRLDSDGEMTGDVRRAEPIAYPGRFEVYPITVGLHYQLLRDRPSDLYIGPLVGWVLTRNADFDTPSGRRPVEVSDGFAYGAVVGADVPLGSGRWVFNCSVRYLSAKFEQDRVPAVLPSSRLGPFDDSTPRELRLDPWVARFGLGYRFDRRSASR